MKKSQSKQEYFNGRIVFTFLVALVSLVACKDQNLEDYKNDKLQRDFATLKSVEGTYTGTMVRKSDGKSLGALQMVLRASTKVQDSVDQSKASAQPILVANVEYQSFQSSADSGKISSAPQPNVIIVAQNVYFEPSSNHLELNIPISVPVTATNNRTVMLSLAGTLYGSQFTGTMEALGHIDQAADVSLKMNGESLNSILSHAGPVVSSVDQVSYVGTTNFQSGEQKPVQLVLLKPQTTPEQDLLFRLTPEKPVLMGLNYGNGARINFSNALMNIKTGMLTGFTQVGNDVLSLSCQDFGVRGMNCSASTSSSGSTVAFLSLKLSTATTTPPATDSSEGRDAMARVYKGSGRIAGVQETYPLELRVFYPARTRIQEIQDLFVPQTEKVVQASFSLTGHDGIGANFPNAKWDSVNGTLDAFQNIVVSNQPENLSLTCTGFHFEKKNYKFECSYVSSFQNTSIRFLFNSSNTAK